MSTDTRLPVGVLGATGLVGQHFVRRLATHPWFRPAALMTSEAHAGSRYREIDWRLPSELPSIVADLPLLACRPENLPEGIQVIFSALPGHVAYEIEAAFAWAGKVVFSNARAYRLKPDMPLLVADLNARHLGAIGYQRAKRGWPGYIVTKANCTSTILAMALGPLQPFGVRRVLVTTFQSVSGAGYPGVASYDILGNVVPFIAGEEEAVQQEMLKLLGAWQPESGFSQAQIVISAQCARVPTLQGHLENVSVELVHRVDPAQLIEAWEQYVPETQHLALPSAPQAPLVYLHAPNRPQPALDYAAGNSMTVSVGRLQPCLALGETGYSFWIVGDNLGRGAVGGSLLNAELCVRRGLIETRRLDLNLTT